jgi:hypothetical protein
MFLFVGNLQAAAVMIFRPLLNIQNVFKKLPSINVFTISDQKKRIAGTQNTGQI